MTTIPWHRTEEEKPQEENAMCWLFGGGTVILGPLPWKWGPDGRGGWLDLFATDSQGCFYTEDAVLYWTEEENISVPKVEH